MRRYTDKNNYPENSYTAAERKVKRLKGFYSHFAVYVVVNIFIYALNVWDAPKGENILQFKYFSTAIFWGIGLFAHGMSVFGQQWLSGSEWEARKIREFMEKEKKEKWE